MNTHQNPEKQISKVGIALALYEPLPAVLAEQIKSFELQDFKSWRCVATSDSPLEGIRSNPLLSRYFSDPRFLFLENPVRLGHKANFDRAIQLIAADESIDAISCSDQDDIWLPSKLTVLIRELEAAPAMALVHSDMTPFSVVDGRRLESVQTLWQAERRNVENAYLDHLLLRSIVNGASMMFDVELARRFGPIPKSVGYHDQWYSALAASQGGVIAVRFSLVLYRQHGSNVVGASTFKGRFAMPTGGKVTRIRELISHFKSRWAETFSLSRSLAERGVRVEPPSLSKLIRVVLSFYWSDPVLARAAAGRLIGRTLTSSSKLNS